LAKALLELDKAACDAGFDDDNFGYHTWVYRAREMQMEENRDNVRMLMANLGLLYSLWKPHFYGPDYTGDGFYQSCRKILEEKGGWYFWCLDRGLKIELL